MTMISVRLPNDLARALRSYAVATKTSFQTIVAEALTRHLKELRTNMHLDEVMPGVK